MFRKHCLTIGLLVAVVGSPAVVAGQGSAALAGGWIVTSWTSPDGQVNAEPQRGVFIFTQTGHYAILYVSAERAQLNANSTDAERLAAYDPFTANAGRYRVNGNELTYEAYVSKHPNYMAGFGPDAANGVTVRWSLSDGILTLEWVSGNNAGRKATLRRPVRAQN